MDTNIQKYRAFLETVRVGNFTKAGQELGYSQANVSHMISGLEHDWGIILMERSRSGVSLTSEGRLLLPIIEDICADYAALLARVDEINGLQSGLIRIGVFQSVATHWLPRIIGAFKSDYPNIDYELHLGNYADIERMLLNGEIDCGFTSLPGPPGFDEMLLAYDELVAVIPTDHPLAKKKVFPIRACDDPAYPFIMVEQGRDAEVTMLLRENGVAPRKMISTWDDYAVMAMVEQGLGISILNRLVLNRCQFNIRVMPFTVKARRSIGLVMKNRNKAPLAVKRFLEYLDLIEQPLPGQLT